MSWRFQRLRDEIIDIAQDRAPVIDLSCALEQNIKAISILISLGSEILRLFTKRKE